MLQKIVVPNTLNKWGGEIMSHRPKPLDLFLYVVLYESFIETKIPRALTHILGGNINQTSLPPFFGHSINNPRN